MNLLEIFDTKVPVTWKHTSTGEEGTFQVDEVFFRLIINKYESIKLKTGNNSGDIIEIAFEKIDPDTQKPIVKRSPVKNSNKVFGAIYNALLTKFKSKWPDTIFFSAKKIGDLGEEHVDRAKFYHRLQQRFIHFGYTRFDPIENSTGTHFILTKVKMIKQDFDDVEELILKMTV